MLEHDSTYYRRRAAAEMSRAQEATKLNSGTSIDRRK